MNETNTNSLNDSNKNNFSKPGELKTIGREIVGKAQGYIYYFIGLAFLGGAGIIFVVIFSSRKDSPGIVLLGILLSIIGFIFFIIGNSKIQKAKFISWVLEALEIYEQIKYNYSKKSESAKNSSKSFITNIDNKIALNRLIDVNKVIGKKVFNISDNIYCGRLIRIDKQRNIVIVKSDFGKELERQIETLQISEKDIYN